jgi:ethanolamine ammonia-lyase large subunit
MDAQALRRVLALASAFKEGDLPVGGTPDERLRAEARLALLAARLADLHATPLIDDGVTEALQESRSRHRDGYWSTWTVADLRRVLLGDQAATWARTFSAGLSSESIAAVVR